MEGSTLVSVCSSFVFAMVASVSLVLLFLYWQKRRRARADNLAEVQRKLQAIDLLKLAQGTPPNAPGPGSQPKPAQKSQADLALDILRYKDSPQPANFVYEDNVQLVGRIVGTRATSPDRYKADCNSGCHANKLCSFWQVGPERNRCVFKNRPMAILGNDSAEDAKKLLGFDPLPECRGKKCMDGWKSGVQMGLHPDRMVHVQDTGPNKGKSDDVQGYKKLAGLYRDMHNSITCNTLCKIAKVFEYIGIATLMLTGFGSSLGALLASTVALDIPGLAVGVVSGAQQANVEKSLQNKLEYVAKGGPFMFHNLADISLKFTNMGIDTIRHCEDNSTTALSPVNIQQLYNIKASGMKQADVEAAKRASDLQCNLGFPDDPKKKELCKTPWGGLISGRLHCEAGENMLNNPRLVPWLSLPAANDNFSTGLYDFFKKRRRQI